MVDNWRPPLPEEIKEGLHCQIIDLRASAESLQNVADVKKHFKRDIQPSIVYKSHIITDNDVEYYKMNPNLINRDIRIISEL